MPGIVVNRSKMAEIVGVTAGTINKFADLGCPSAHRPNVRGQEWLFNTADVIKWLQERAVRSATGNPANADTADAKARKLIADAERAEMETARLAGTVIPIAWVDEIFGRQLALIAAKLAALPERAAPLIAGETNPRTIATKLRRIIEELKGELRELPGEIERRQKDERGQSR